MDSDRTRTIFITIIATTGVVAAITMSIIAIAQTGDRTPSAPAVPVNNTAAAAAPAAKPQVASVVISHVVRGCHAMLVNGQMPMTPKATLHLTPGSTLHVVDNDIMPHKLVQLAGPSIQVGGAAMDHMGATGTVKFPAAGTYVLSTKAGEDYPNVKAPETIGADNVLKLKVVVAA